MPDDYSFAGGGLKLKGGVTGAGVGKKRKKKKKVEGKDGEKGEGKEGGVETELQKALREEDGEDKVDEDGDTGSDLEEKDGEGKTEAERRREDMRRRRLIQRLEREGVKTHKQRVEELNRYLSTLSEHHDMPRIGPG
ncbi:DUF1754 superfamily protein [Rutstroemia sp. NJR-2017a BBW]|nr:DUF1754 superfamily protein [Rutstroemia sp. NJR-2017a BBW]